MFTVLRWGFYFSPGNTGTLFQRRLAHWQRLAWYFQGPGLSAAPKISIKIKLEEFLTHPNKGQNRATITAEQLLVPPNVFPRN